MARAADRLGMGGSAAIQGIDSAAASVTAQVIADLGDVDRVLDRALGPLTEGGATIAELCGLATIRDELTTEAATWADDLARGTGHLARTLYGPRYALCGTFLAWQQAAGIASANDRGAMVERLAANANEAIAATGPPGTRAGQAATQVATTGTALADWLLQRSHDLRVAEQDP